MIKLLSSVLALTVMLSAGANAAESKKELTKESTPVVATMPAAVPATTGTGNSLPTTNNTQEGTIVETGTSGQHSEPAKGEIIKK